jgi:hypothetical protein
MKNTKEDALIDFLGTEKPKDSPTDDSDENIDSDHKTEILDEREGLIERVDRILVTRDGKQLLREQY